jgi:hypothetical protein
MALLDVAPSPRVHLQDRASGIIFSNGLSSALFRFSLSRLQAIDFESRIPGQTLDLTSRRRYIRHTFRQAVSFARRYGAQSLDE